MQRLHSFFEQQEVREHELPPGNITCYAQSPSQLFVGCDDGSVHALDDRLHALSSFPAHGHKVLEARWLQGARMLLTLGVEEPGISSATLKLWEGLERPAGAAAAAAASGSAPSPCRVLKLFSSKYPESDVTALAVHEPGEAPAAGTATIAVGLGSGYVYLLQAEGLSSSRPRLSHVARLSARPAGGDVWAVMAVHLLGSGALLSAFVVTEAETLSFTLQPPGLAVVQRTVLDPQGAASARCTCMRDHLLLVGRDQGVYEYTLDSRAGCSAFEGRKALLAPLGRYLLLVTTAIASEDGVATSTVSLTDVRNKLVAGSFTLPNVRTVLPAFGASVYVLTGGGAVLLLHELELAAQLEALLRRAQFKLALDIGRGQGLEGEGLAAIHQRWADHLYARGEYDAAMGQYTQTIGHLEPSYVIRRFLDAQRIACLTAYLEALHEQGAAAADHTTLLLNCYTKLKDLAKLDAFLQRDASGGGLVASSKQLSFDAEAAVKVLRAAGYSRHALWVAQQAGQPHWVLDILTEDQGDADGALAYLSTLGRRAAAGALRTYGKLLVNARPEETTRLLMELCCPPGNADRGGGGDGSTAAAASSAAVPSATAALPSTAAPSSTSSADDSSYMASVSDFAHLYAERPTALMLLCEFVLASQAAPPAKALLHHTLLDLYLTADLTDQQQQQQDEAAAAAAGGPGTSANASQAAGSASSAEASASGLQPQPGALSTSARRAKALELLQSGWQPHMEAPAYDAETAAVLCRLAAFRPGLAFLYDRMRLHSEVLQLHIEAGDQEGLISACIKYGDASKGGDPQLWVAALDYFVGQPGKANEHMLEVLEHIEAGEVLPPLVVLQALARKPGLQVALVKDYVARALKQEMLEAARDREAVRRLVAETGAMRSELARLKTQAHVFQNTRCAATQQPLELPVVHFLCGHSFNWRSLSDTEQPECPLCAPEFRRVTEIRRALAASALQQDRFFTELREAPDGFSVVADHFGRGLMNATSSSSAGGGGVAAGGSDGA